MWRRQSPRVDEVVSNDDVARGMDSSHSAASWSWVNKCRLPDMNVHQYQLQLSLLAAKQAPQVSACMRCCCSGRQLHGMLEDEVRGILRSMGKRER